VVSGQAVLKELFDGRFGFDADSCGIRDGDGHAAAWSLGRRSLSLVVVFAVAQSLAFRIAAFTQLLIGGKSLSKGGLVDQDPARRRPDGW
jgi:hypothetical protein